MEADLVSDARQRHRLRPCSTPGGQLQAPHNSVRWDAAASVRHRKQPPSAVIERSRRSSCGSQDMQA